MTDVTFRRADLGTAELPAYPGIGLDRITLVVSDTLAASALRALMAADAIGFDTESKPTFLKGEASTGPHLIQLATENHAYLFPISRPPRSMPCAKSSNPRRCARWDSGSATTAAR